MLIYVPYGSLRVHAGDISRRAQDFDRTIAIGVNWIYLTGREPVMKNVHQAFCALLPVKTGGDVRHADQGTHEIDGVEVVTDVAALGRRA